MNKTLTSRFISAVAGVAVAATLISVPASAQQSGHTRPVIGVLNTEIIERDSLAAKGVRLERDKYISLYQQEIKTIEAELREEEQRLTQQRNVLSPEVFQQQVEEFQEKFAVEQQTLQVKQQNLQAVYQQSMIVINQEVLKISSQIAQERGINLVMAQNLVLLSDPSMDVTRPVLELLNERLPQVAFQNPEGDVAQADGEAAAE